MDYATNKQDMYTMLQIVISLFTHLVGKLPVLHFFSVAES